MTNVQVKHAMILAAGRGERLRPLTDKTPKPLIKVGDHCLIEHQIQALQRAGIQEIVINICWLGEKICSTLGNGTRYGVTIHYSDESERVLETAGGIVKALPLLGKAPFIVCNADIWTDIDYAALVLPAGALAHLVLVDNPRYHQGDFSLSDGWLQNDEDTRYTFSGIGIYHPDFFADTPSGKAPLAPLLHKGIMQRVISASVHKGVWFDVGTVERLAEVNAYLMEEK